MSVHAAAQKGSTPMTCSSKLALVTLLAGLLSLATVATVSAGPPCTGVAREHCEQMASANDVTSFSVAAVAPVHVPNGNGMGQEHLEAMTAQTATP